MISTDRATESGLPSPMTKPLRGLQVVDFGQYLAGPMAAVMLADQGAEVVRIDPPGGPRWDTPANTVLLRARTRRTLDLKHRRDLTEAQQLIDTADVVIENFRPGVADRLGIGAAAACERNSRLVYCSLPGFGSDEPRATEPGWEGVVLAAAAAYATGSTEMLHGEWWPTNGPAFSPLLLASVFSAIQGAVGVMAALVARERDGTGQQVEVPLHDAFLEGIGARALRYERNAPGGATLGSGVYACSDGGYVSLITVSFRHLEWFVAAAGVPSWIDEGLVDFHRLMNDQEAVAELSRRLVELLATRPALEWEALGQQAGVPIAAMRSTRDWMQEEHALASGTMRDEQHPDLGVVRVPGTAVKVEQRPVTGGQPSSARRDEPAATSAEPPLRGLHVLDVSRVLAAPSASRLLADLGADVIRADADLSNATLALRQPVFHEQTNRGKQTVIVDLETDVGSADLQRLLRWADVVVTNFSLPRLGALGLDEDSVRAAAPGIVYVYLNAFGTSGPWAPRRGYAEIANMVSGITERTLGDGPPSGAAPTIDLPRCPFTDYGAGFLAAFGALTARYRQLQSSGGFRVETSLVSAACWQQLPYAIDHAEQRWDEPRPPARGWNARHRLYQAADGWVFVGLTEAQWWDLLAAAGRPETDTQPPSAWLETWISARSTRECRALVSTVGGGSHEVVSLDELLTPGGMADKRGLRLSQRSEEFGTVVQPGPAIRLHRTHVRAGSLPRPLGTDRMSALPLDLPSDQ